MTLKIWFLYLFIRIIFATVEVCRVGEYPSAVAIINTATKESSCTGVLITPKSVVTAGHCLMLSMKLKNLLVVAGATDIMKNNTEFWQSRKVSRQITFPKEAAVLNDIAILKMKYPFEVNKNIKESKVKPKAIETNQTGFIVGWSLTAKQMTPKMKKAVVVTECPKHVHTPNVFCGSYPDNDFQSCPGDSGSPLYIDDNVRGILLGGACRTPGTHLIFLKINNYGNWISKNRSCQKELRLSLKLFSIFIIALRASSKSNIGMDFISLFSILNECQEI